MKYGESFENIGPHRKERGVKKTEGMRRDRKVTLVFLCKIKALFTCVASLLLI